MCRRQCHRALLILDGAGWHVSPRLAVPDNIVILSLPPYAAELNSTENIWEYPRGNCLGHCAGAFFHRHRLDGVIGSTPSIDGSLFLDEGQDSIELALQVRHAGLADLRSWPDARCAARLPDRRTWVFLMFWLGRLWHRGLGASNAGRRAKLCTKISPDRTKMFHVKHFGTIDGLCKRTFAARGKIRNGDLAQAENRDRFMLYALRFFRNVFPATAGPQEGHAAIICAWPRRFRSGGAWPS